MIAEAATRPAAPRAAPVAAAPTPPALSAPPAPPGPLVSVERRMMGGRVGIHLSADDGEELEAQRQAERALRRIACWAGRLSRFESDSDLSRLNRAPGSAVSVRPTLAAVLDWARVAESTTDGIVDVTLLDERLAAELAPDAMPETVTELHTTDGAPIASRAWALRRAARGTRVVRPAGLRLDLDGVAKGWLADRALGLVGGHRVAMVDADGDVAVALGPGADVALAVADPDDPRQSVAILRLRGDLDGPVLDDSGRAFGVATSGTSVHRWGSGTSLRHHLIDPRTGRSARTDIDQATVVSSSARLAEALAKAALIAGTDRAAAMLDRPDVHVAILIMSDGRQLAVGDVSGFVEPSSGSPR